MFASFVHFLRDDNGAITVDYTVLSAAAVGMAIAATAVITGGVQSLTSRIDEELRLRQLNDSFIAFTAAHFEALFAANILSEAEAQALWEAANTLMNNELLAALEEGITKIQNGTLTEEEYGELFAVASVVYQRNIVDDAILNYYFGFDGSTPPVEYAG